MKVYTKTGDKGTTGLLGGTRVLKSNIRIEAYGTVDELNSHVGMVRDQPACQESDRSVGGKEAELIEIQNALFVIGSHLAADPKKSKVEIPPLEVKWIDSLEKLIDNLDQELPKMRNFILPGGHVSVSACHIARCVCRRAERSVIALAQIEPIDQTIIIYLNRLSDYLFVLSRWIALKTDAKEIVWKPS